jgi:hypothetical protein
LTALVSLARLLSGDGLLTEGLVVSFYMEGVGGNGNRFDSQSQCQALWGRGRVQGEPGRFVTEGTARVGSPCNQSPFVFGSCQSGLRRWTYV